MKNVIWVVVIGVSMLVSFLIREKDADISNLKEFNKGGISFKYPANWSVHVDPELEKAGVTFI